MKWMKTLRRSLDVEQEEVVRIAFDNVNYLTTMGNNLAMLKNLKVENGHSLRLTHSKPRKDPRETII